MWRFIAVYTVTNENMAMVWDTSHHLIPSPLRWTGLRKAAIHWKNSRMTIPRITERLKSMRMDKRVGGVP